jgi:hypothetical protein
VLESRENHLLRGSISKRQLLAVYRRTNLCQVQRVE